MDRESCSKVKTWRSVMQKFDDVLIGTIDEVVRNVFKDDIAEVIFQYLKESGQKKK